MKRSLSSPAPAQLKKLESMARKAAGRAYAPYSHFPVGAALLDSSGKMFAGCNVENASFGLSNCAERTAIFTAIAAASKPVRVRCLVVYTPTKTATMPCGACRQVIHEFGPETRVISICDTRDRIDVAGSTLLPGAFGPGDLAPN
jgi:cytidine deaminase